MRGKNITTPSERPHKAVMGDVATAWDRRGRHGPGQIGDAAIKFLTNKYLFAQKNKPVAGPTIQQSHPGQGMEFVFTHMSIQGNGNANQTAME